MQFHDNALPSEFLKILHGKQELETKLSEKNIIFTLLRREIYQRVYTCAIKPNRGQV